VSHPIEIISRWPHQRPTAWALIRAVAWVAPLVCAVLLIRHVTHAPKPPTYPSPSEEAPFGVPMADCRKVYEEVAGYSQSWRAQARRSFPTHVWSQEDEYRNIMRRHVHLMEARYPYHYSQIFMCIDLGVRSAWPRLTGDKSPLEPQVPPLNPRTE
jgi:hypothetical protein